jgi:hypothetical protein
MKYVISNTISLPLESFDRPLEDDQKIPREVRLYWGFLWMLCLLQDRVVDVTILIQKSFFLSKLYYMYRIISSNGKRSNVLKKGTTVNTIYLPYFVIDTTHNNSIKYRKWSTETKSQGPALDANWIVRFFILLQYLHN